MTEQQLDHETDAQDVEQQNVEQVTAYTQAEQRHYQEIRELTDRVERLAADMEAKKEDASASKKAYDSAVLTLRSTIRRGPDLQGELPFDQADNDAWRELPVAELVGCGLAEAVAAKLADEEIKTLGELSERMAEYGTTWWWHEVAGIGQGKAEKVEAALAEFWSQHPEYAEDQVDSPSGDDGEDEEDEVDGDE